MHKPRPVVVWLKQYLICLDPEAVQLAEDLFLMLHKLKGGRKNKAGQYQELQRKLTHFYVQSTWTFICCLQIPFTVYLFDQELNVIYYLKKQTLNKYVEEQSTDERMIISMLSILSHFLMTNCYQFIPINMCIAIKDI